MKRKAQEVRQQAVEEEAVPKEKTKKRGGKASDLRGIAKGQVAQVQVVLTTPSLTTVKKKKERPTQMAAAPISDPFKNFPPALLDRLRVEQKRHFDGALAILQTSLAVQGEDADIFLSLNSQEYHFLFLVCCAKSEGSNHFRSEWLVYPTGCDNQAIAAKAVKFKKWLSGLGYEFRDGSFTVIKKKAP